MLKQNFRSRRTNQQLSSIIAHRFYFAMVTARAHNGSNVRSRVPVYYVRSYVQMLTPDSRSLSDPAQTPSTGSSFPNHVTTNLPDLFPLGACDLSSIPVASDICSWPGFFPLAKTFRDFTSAIFHEALPKSFQLLTAVFLLSTSPKSFLNILTTQFWYILSSYRFVHSGKTVDLLNILIVKKFSRMVLKWNYYPHISGLKIWIQSMQKFVEYN